MKFLRRYNNKDKSSFTMTIKVELVEDKVNLYTVLFYPECQDGAKEEIVRLLVKNNGWRVWGRVSIQKKIRTVICKDNIGENELADDLLYIDAYWQSLNLWTQKDPEQDICLPVEQFLYLVDRLSWTIGNNICSPKKGDIIPFLENFGFKESRHLGMW